MPCFDPPRPDRHDINEAWRQRDKMVDTLKEIDTYCKAFDHPIAKEVRCIIDRHWGRAIHL